MMLNKGYILFKTEAGHDYLYDMIQKLPVYLHPLTAYFLNVYQNNESLDDLHLIESTSLDYSPEEIQYYLQKARFFIENGFLKNNDFGNTYTERMSAEDIEYEFINSNHICFEITENCNLHCAYCIYGDKYDHYDVRRGRKMSFSMARTLIDHKIDLWKSQKTSSVNITKLIGFYGGEPLLNFSLIEEIVNYLKQLELKEKIRFRFDITTNGLLLNRHIDFLVKHDFEISISLDGDEKDNKYRTFKDKRPSFEYVFDNIRFLKEKYPDYFDRRVRFFSVYHHLSDYRAIRLFFREQTGKKNQFIELNPIGDASDLYKPIETHIKRAYNPKTDKYKMFSRYRITYFNELFVETEAARIPTKTCIPFVSKIFVTATGKILSCETIPHSFTLGYVTAKEVDIDFNQAAKVCNSQIDKISGLCCFCYNYRTCTQCALQVTDGQCPEFQNEAQYKLKVSRLIHLYEMSH